MNIDVISYLITFFISRIAFIISLPLNIFSIATCGAPKNAPIGDNSLSFSSSGDTILNLYPSRISFLHSNEPKYGDAPPPVPNIPAPIAIQSISSGVSIHSLLPSLNSTLIY